MVEGGHGTVRHFFGSIFEVIYLYSVDFGGYLFVLFKFLN